MIGILSEAPDPKRTISVQIRIVPVDAPARLYLGVVDLEQLSSRLTLCELYITNWMHMIYLQSI